MNQAFLEQYHMPAKPQNTQSHPLPANSLHGPEQDAWLDPEFEAGLVTVIVPVYNRSELITEALDSIIAQTYRPIEVVIVDDGSIDGTGSAIIEWQDRHRPDRDCKIRYEYQENRGAPAARNRGMILAKGEFLQFLDSDDVLFDDKIERAVRFLTALNADMVYSATEITDGKGQPVGVMGQNVDGRAADIPAYSWHITGPVYRRRMLIDVGPWLETLTGCQDWEYCARVKLGDYKIFFDEKVGSRYRQLDTRRISKPGFDHRYTKSAEVACDSIRNLAGQIGKLDKDLNSRMARLYLYRALEFRYQGHESDARRCLRKARQGPVRRNHVWYLSHIFSLMSFRMLAGLALKVLGLRSSLPRS